MSAGFPTSACIIDDDVDFVNFLSEYLQSRGCQARGFHSAEDLMASGEIDRFEFFIVDLMLPGIDGVDLISLIRARTNAGILVISGRMGPDAFNSVLAAGADMFINKPIRFDQVYHSMVSIMRRVGDIRPENASWLFDEAGEMLIAPGGDCARLSPLETAMLAALRARQGEPLTRVELAEAAGISPGADYRNLDAAMFRLRRKIERDTRQPSPIRTVHGVGYQLSAPFETGAATGGKRP